jgi:CheY-like chemotaxis protein
MLAISVLVVDDNIHMRGILKELLRAMGILNVREAADVEEAMDLIKTNVIDLIIADVSMPEIDGIEFTRMLRSDPRSPNPYVPILIVSGHSERSRRPATPDARSSSSSR